VSFYPIVKRRKFSKMASNDEDIWIIVIFVLVAILFFGTCLCVCSVIKDYIKKNNDDTIEETFKEVTEGTELTENDSKYVSVLCS